jgi:hypothetical protein
MAKVMRMSECQKAMNRAAKKLGIARLTHHDLRHLFATRCIESGVDIPTVSRWLGHKDGGALARKVYGHLRDHDSANMAQKVMFSETEPKAAPLPSAETAPQNGRADAANGTDKKANAQAKAKYAYPWWASANPLEVFWGQLIEEVQIVPLEKYRRCAQEAMKREVFAEELADRQALKDELMERVAKMTLDEITAKIQAKQAGQGRKKHRECKRQRKETALQVRQNRTTTLSARERYRNVVWAWPQPAASNSRNSPSPGGRASLPDRQIKATSRRPACSHRGS